jgi:hypothetical protein
VIGGSSFKASPGKKLARPISENKLIYACNPSHEGGIRRRITVQGLSRAKALTPYLKNT